jgi:hypothetical protein
LRGKLALALSSAKRFLTIGFIAECDGLLLGDDHRWT